MVLDRNDFFLHATDRKKDSLASPGTASATAQTFYSEVRDFGAAGALDGHLKKFVCLKGVSALSAGTYTITLEHDSAEAFGTVATALTLVSAANIAATTLLKFALPADLKRYVRIKAVTSATNHTAGTGEFKTFLTMQ
jgi:hypothetical protein